MSRLFRILHTEASIGWGGQEIRILQESQWFASRGHRVFIGCSPVSKIQERFAGREISNLSIHTLPFRRTLDPSDIIPVYRMIRKERVDIVHTHSSIDSWNASLAAMLAGVPIVRSRHVSIPVKNFFPRNLVYKFPHRIITSGKRIEEIIAGLQTTSREKVLSIPAGVDTERFQPGIDGSRVREEFNIPRNAFLVGKVAIIRLWKGHPDFIDAAEILLKRNDNLFFLVVGNGPGYERIKRKILSKNLEKKIIMTGYREDIPEVISSLDVLVLASTSGEATSQVIPQAWACKKCVLATTAGGIPEIVRHRENGFLVPPNDPEKMAEGLHLLINNPEMKARLADAGYSFAMENLTQEAMMERTFSVYKELV